MKNKNLEKIILRKKTSPLLKTPEKDFHWLQVIFQTEQDLKIRLPFVFQNTYPPRGVGNTL